LRSTRRADTADGTVWSARWAAPEAPAVRPALRAAQEAEGSAEPRARAAVPRTGPEGDGGTGGAFPGDAHNGTARQAGYVQLRIVGATVSVQP
jgi:hypothetical protein